jgi:DNA repair protein RecO (recombination protein O)
VALQKSHGVVLRRRDFGEADRILTVFTRRFGLIKAIAKGCRRPRSRLAGHLEPCQAAEFVFWKREGGGLAIVRSAELLEPQPGLSEDFGSFAAAQFACELLDRSLPEGEPQPRLYLLLLQFLRALKRPEHVLSALLAFTVRAADLLGYGLGLDACAGCGDRLSSDHEAWLEVRSGEGNAASELLAPGVLSALRGVSTNPPRTAPDAEAQAAVHALDRLLAWHQDRRSLASGKLLAGHGSGIMGNRT